MLKHWGDTRMKHVPVSPAFWLAVSRAARAACARVCVDNQWPWLQELDDVEKYLARGR